MQVFRENFKPWWKVFVIAYLVTMAVLVILWLATGSGLYHAFDQALMHVESKGILTQTEVHYPVIALLLTTIVMMLPLLVVRIALGHRVRIHDPDVPNVMSL